MFKLVAALLAPLMVYASDLPSKKYLNLAAVKTMVAAAEAKAKELNVSVTICIVDESGNLLFLEKGDTASLNTLQFAQKKGRRGCSEERQHLRNVVSGILSQSGRGTHPCRRPDSWWNLSQWRKVGDRR